jgi:hypothetical protein
MEEDRHPLIMTNMLFKFIPLQVVSDFRSKCADTSADIEETYVMGHRLLAFLGKALPQHPVSGHA